MAWLHDRVEQLDAEARSALELAAQLCAQRTHLGVGLPHLLAALVERSLPVRDALREAGVDPFAVSRKAQQRLNLLVAGCERVPPLQPEIVRVIVEATEGRSCGVGSLELLQAMLRVPEVRLLAGELAEELTVIPIESRRERAEPRNARLASLGGSSPCESAAEVDRSAKESQRMVEANRMRLGRFEFVIDFGSFRRITACWSGPGWDFNFSGACVNDDPANPTFWDGRIGVYCEAAPLPLAKAADYTGVEVELPGSYDEATGEPYFAVDVGESYEVSDARLRFAARDGGRYLIELSGTTPVLGHPERFELSAWADELPDHAYSG